MFKTRIAGKAKLIKDRENQVKIKINGLHNIHGLKRSKLLGIDSILKQNSTFAEKAPVMTFFMGELAAFQVYSIVL